MKKTVWGLATIIDLDRGSHIPLYRQLYDSLRQAILTGQLQPGQRLPATRDLSVELGISRNTALNALDQLLAEGYLESRVGSGTYVTHAIPEQALHARRLATKPARSTAKPPVLSRYTSALTKSPLSLSPVQGPIHAFQLGIPGALEAPQLALWSRLTARVCRDPMTLARGYSEAMGFGALREAIATYLRTARGVNCEADRIIIVNGSQQALDLVARVLLNQGDTAWVEDPGYPGVWSVLAGQGVEIIPVPVDRQGLRVEAGLELAPRPKLVYVTPSNQFPLGVTMSLTRRLQLLESVTGSGAWILEDDYDSEYRYSGRPLGSLQGIDSTGKVIYVGTFSKVLTPGLRLGYLVIPHELVDAFVSAKTSCDRGSPQIEQAVLASFIEEGHFGRHIRRTRLTYQARRDVLVAAAANKLKGLLDIEPQESGMHLIGWLPQRTSDRAASTRAAQAGVYADPLSHFTVRAQIRPGLILGFAAFDEKEILRGVHLLAKALSSKHK
ncbi:MAG: PLP-dependent aminotransferase family protein [Ignavibacteria bacterium]|nr:PLP-dependent aminotransferase family protein [Ignavibacteria bacterium]